MRHKTYQIFAILLVLCVLPVTVAFGEGPVYTVDDVRDIVGKARVDETYTESEINQIIVKYNEIERANAYAKMFELGKSIDVDSAVEKEYVALDKKITELRKKLANSYKEGKSLEEVLKLNTELQSAVHKISSLKEKGYDLDIEFIVNEWADEYNRVQQNIQQMGADYTVGDVGQVLRSPVQSRFYLSSPFGFRLDPITKAELTMHNGIDLAAYDNEPILALWNGVVSNVYVSETGGNTVEISHGKYLKTSYLHLNKAIVHIGQEVKQYETIGLAGNTGTRSTGTHLHLIVELDGEKINPLYVFGTKGLNAFKEYISYHPERNRELGDIETIMKDAPTKPKEEEILDTNRYPRSAKDVEGAIPVAPTDIKPMPYDPSKPFGKDNTTNSEKDTVVTPVVTPQKKE